MSLILEALKKSERERQLGELPSLSTPSQPLRRRRSLLPWLVLLILIAAAVAWWLKRQAAESTAPATTAVATVDATTADVAPSAVVPAPAADPAEAEQGGLVHDTRPRESTTSVAPSAATPAINPEPGMPAVAPIAPPRELLEKSRQGASIEAAPAPAAATTPTPAPELPAPSAAPVAVPAVPAGPPLMWELPYAVRKDLPELNVTMQVYADNPVNRFVIVNGERLAEGEELDGLQVIEIRGDGIVFAYRSERFLYPRGGR